MHAAAKLVEDYLRLLMIPDPESARRHCSPEMEIRFTGNRAMRDPHVPERGTEAETFVYQTGTLYGEWPAEWLLVRAGLAKP